MLAWGDRQTRRRSLYNATASLRLWRPSRGLVVVVAAAGALCCAGCSIPLESLSSHPDAKLDQTSLISRAGGGPGEHAIALPSEIDLAYARAAAADALAHDNTNNSVPWQNPQTGVGGNITPLASSYSEKGLACRDFLASYLRGGSQTWLQGAACRSRGGKWRVKNLTPLRSG